MRLIKIHISILFVVVALGWFMLPVKGETVQSKPSTGEVALQKPLVIDGREAEEIWINTGQGRFRFTVEIADEEIERSTGLMFRENMPATHGMLFDFGTPRVIQMWMRNTPSSLDMIFIDTTGRITKIAERTTPFSDAIISSQDPASFVLEINGGVARLLGMKQGDIIEHRLFTKP